MRARGRLNKMKKFMFLFLSLTCFCLSCRAEVLGPVVVGAAVRKLEDKAVARKKTIVDDLMVLQVGDQIFYVKDLDLLEDLVSSGQDMCFEYGNDLVGEINNLYHVLYDACVAGRARLREQINTSADVSNIKKGTFTALQAIRRLQSSEKLHNITNQEYDYKSMLVNCLLDKELLTRALQKTNQDVYDYRLGYDMDSCIKSVTVNKNAMCSRSDLFVPDSSCLDNMNDLDIKYAGKTFQFTEGLQSNNTSNKVLIFNGKVLVACENGLAQYVIKPSFSGRSYCQDGAYQYVGGVGHLPNGVYLALVNHKEAMQGEQQNAWGKHRVPLVPSVSNKSVGRSGFYLHGTEIKDKRRSGGCISLGVAVDELVETDWFGAEEYIPVVVDAVDSISQEDRDKCEYNQ